MSVTLIGGVGSSVLNEVLSLNAQEYHAYIRPARHQASLLNEVLSLNAQEWNVCPFGTTNCVSSMKS